MRITELAVKFKTTVYVMIAIIAVIGAMAYNSIPLEEMPEVEIPMIIVNTVYAGVAPEDMERLVTNVLERELKSLKDVEEMTSSSKESVSTVVIEFETGVDIDDAYQKVREKVDNAKPDLPEDADEPVLIEITTSDFPVMIINVMADYDQGKLKVVADKLKERIEAVPGVLEVQDVGGLEREIQVYLDPLKLEYYKVSVGQVINRIGEEHLNMPAGNIDLGNTKYSVRVPAEYKDVSLMENIVVKAPEGRPVTIRDIGRVIDGYEDRESYSRADGTSCVTLRITKRTGENVVEVIDNIKLLLEAEMPNLPDGTSYIVSSDESVNVIDMLGTLQNTIITGLILVLIVLLFAMGVRNASFVALAIPLSMLIAIAVINYMGFTMNMVVMFGLIIALGMLVDNSIVVIENIYRHTGEGLSREEAAVIGTKEVAWPIITSTATTVAAFFPLVFWPGIMGEFFGYLPKTVITVLLGTLFVALVINPAVSSSFLKTEGKKLFDDSGETKSWHMKLYKAVLTWSLANPIKTIMAASGVLLITVTIFVIFNAGLEFLPSTTPARAQITVEAPQGTIIDATDEYIKKIEAIASKDENADFVIGNAGLNSSRFSVGSGGADSNFGVVDIEFLDHDERKTSSWKSVESFRKQLANLAGAEIKVDAEEMGPPAGEPVSVEISGEDFETLNKLAKQAKELIATVPGAVDIEDDFESGKPEIKVDIDREQAKIRTVNTASISNVVRTAINGTKAGVLREGDEEYDITVRYDEQFRTTIDDVRNLMIAGKDNVQIPLSDVATVYTTGGKGSINHIDRNRTVKITADVSGRSSSEVMMDVKALLREKMDMPSGYIMSFTGESEEQDKAVEFLSEAFTIALMIMFMILITQFNSLSRPAIILASVVMSMNGVMIGLLVTQSRFSVIMTGMGIISLAGVVVNNAIVLIDYTDKLREGGASVRDALVKAGIVRFRPVMLTAITTILGMLPMAAGISVDFVNFRLEMGTPSSEMWSPMATAIIFGLAFATMLTLILVPALYAFQEDSIAKLQSARDILSKKLNPKKKKAAPKEDLSKDENHEK